MQNPIIDKLDRLHFNKGNRVRYRAIVTLGVIIAAGLTMIGLEVVAVICNVATCAVWIWE